MEIHYLTLTDEGLSAYRDELREEILGIDRVQEQLYRRYEQCIVLMGEVLDELNRRQSEANTPKGCGKCCS